MKAEDLMVGDFLRYKQDFPDTHLQGKIVKVCGIRGRVDAITIDDGNFHESEHSDWLEPIPLTPEILERNGFRSYGDSWYIPCDDENVRIGFHMYVTVLDIKTDNVSLYKKLPYGYRSTVKDETLSVHELQHALRLCEIDQEIVL